MRIAVVGAGAVGARAARQLASTESVTEVVLRDTDPARLAEVAASLGEVATVEAPPYDRPPAADAVVLAAPAGTHVHAARELVAREIPVVSTVDDVDEVRGLLELGPEAEVRGVVVAVGAGFSPGLTCVMARHAAAGFDRVDEIHVAKAGTGGPDGSRLARRRLGPPSGWIGP
jgi:saccharopine dehydrogenase-like NADP-dependent oxidoreductase